MTALRPHALPLLFLLLVTVVAYFEVPAHEMLATWDDQLYVTGNPAIRGFDLHNLSLAFTTPYAGNYAPVQILSYMLDYTVWGDNPFGYFLANICYHLAAGILLYLLLVRTGFNVWGAAIGSALFLVHPVQVESVAWISQRKTLLAMLFYLAAFHAYLGYRLRSDDRKWGWYVVSVMLFLLSLLSKSVAVIFPLTLVLFDLLVMPVRRSLREYADLLPFLMAAAAVGVLALITQSAEMHGGRIPYPHNPWLTIPLTMLPVLISYLRLLLWPDPASLCILYFPETKYHPDGMVVFSLFAVVGLLLAGWFLYRKERSRLFWYLLFFVGLLPVSQIIPIATLMNERYLYFPLMGIAGLVASGYESLQGMSRPPLLRKIIITCLVGGVVLLSIAGNIRSRVWQNGIGLFSDAAAKLPHERDPWTLLAESHLAKGEWAAARLYYEKAEKLGPLGATDQFKLAGIYLEDGELDKAYRSIWKLLLIDSQSAEGRLLLGEYYLAKGEYSEAERQLSGYVTANPDSARGFYLLGRIESIKGAYAKARERFIKAILLKGSDADMYLAVSCADLKLERQNEAYDYLQQAFRRGLSLEQLQKDKACAALIRGNPRFEALGNQFSGQK